MAFKKKLTAGWHLSDGILNTFPIGNLTDVMSAVVKAGYAPDPLSGLNLMKGEWIYGRRWEYISHFDTPTEGDERVSLFFERMAGWGEVFVNGQRAGAFESGEAYLDITGLIAGAQNELSVRFQAPGLSLPADNPMPVLGIAGPVWLATGNYITLEHTVSRTVGATAVIEHDITAHTAGKFSFIYTVSQNGALVNRSEFIEKLPAARVTRSHTISLSARPGEAELSGAACDVCVSVERGGIGCAQVRFEAALPGRDGRRAVLVRGGSLSEEAAQSLRELNADGVCFEKESFRRVDGDCVFGLKKLTRADGLFSRNACVAADTLRGEADGESFWPPRTPLWRLRGGAQPDLEELKTLYGDAACADGLLAARLSRYEQAEAVFRQAVRCRQSGKKALFAWNAGWESLCSDALVERGGRRRPAWLALKKAWAHDVAWADLPEHFAAEPGAALEIPVWAMSDRPGGIEASVSVSVYRVDGCRIGQLKETAQVGRPARVGALSVSVPAEPVLIVRSEMTSRDGAVLSKVDALLPVKGEGAPLAGALIGPASLTRTLGRVTNDGDLAALAAGDALLPGERIADDGGEWLNEAKTPV